MPSLKTLPALALVTLCAAAQTAPDQVTVEVAATDKSGFAKNLSAQDFKLWEDNKEQTIASAVVRAPGKHAIVLLFDNTTVSVRIQSDVRGYVEHFIDAAAGPRNYMEVAAFFSGIRVLQPFTTDAGLLKNALTDTESSAVMNSSGQSGVAGGISSAATSGRSSGSAGRASNQVRNGAQITGGTASPENEMKSEAMMESFQGLVESLAPIKGRKTIILFSGGQSFSQEVTKYVDKVIDEANKNDVAIYGIAASADNSGMAFVKTFSDATGGTSIKQTPNLPDALKQILQEQDEYYSVTFTPNNAGDPAGVCRDLRVKAETPGVEARARKSYCAPKKADALAGTPTGKELDARLTGNGAGSLGASLQAPYFYGESNTSQARVNVVLETATSGIVFHKEKGKEHGELNAEGAAYRPDGSVAARFSETLPFDFADQKEADAFAKLPFHYENQLWLPPGQYTIKAVISPSADVFGKAEQKVAVEARDAGKLSMSGIALSRELRDAKGGVAGLPADMIEGQTPLIASGKEIVPTGSERFRTNERALFYTEVYDPALAGANPPQVSMRFRVLDRTSGAVKSDSGAASVSGYVKAGNPVVGVASTIPETGLGPGAYRLEITTSHSSGPETVVRSVDFDLN